jgi:hypothetical protein
VIQPFSGVSRAAGLGSSASKQFVDMSDVHVLTDTGVTSLSYGAVLWLIERATLEFPDGTLDRLDQGLADGIVALNASDLAAISEFFYEQLDAADNPTSTRSAPEVSELTAALSTWSRTELP